MGLVNVIHVTRICVCLKQKKFAEVLHENRIKFPKGLNGLLHGLCYFRVVFLCTSKKVSILTAKKA